MIDPNLYSDFTRKETLAFHILNEEARYLEMLTKHLTAVTNAVQAKVKENEIKKAHLLKGRLGEFHNQHLDTLTKRLVNDVKYRQLADEKLSLINKRLPLTGKYEIFDDNQKTSHGTDEWLIKNVIPSGIQEKNIWDSWTQHSKLLGITPKIDPPFSGPPVESQEVKDYVDNRARAFLVQPPIKITGQRITLK